MSHAIEDRAALHFAAAFYQALGYGRDLQTAYQLGCLEIALDDAAGEELPQLIVRRTDPATIHLLHPTHPRRASLPPLPPERTGVEIYCRKPWSKLGISPRCTITLQNSGFVLKHKLMWEAFVFIPLEPHRDYELRINRPSDIISFQARVQFALKSGEVKRYIYESPALSFQAGDIRPFSPRDLSA